MAKMEQRVISFNGYHDHLLINSGTLRQREKFPGFCSNISITANVTWLSYLSRLQECGLMNLGSASQFIVDFPAPVIQVQTHELGPIDSKGGERLQESAGPGPPKRVHTNPCTVQRGLMLLATFGLLIGTAVGVWFLVKQLLKPLPLPETPPFQDTEALLTRCRDVMEEKEEDEEDGAPFGTAGGKKVSFRVNRDTFLLEVQAGDLPSWLPVCHDGWDLALGTWICRRLGHVRLTHHKGVNLTDVKVNNAQAFAQLTPNWKGNVEDMLQIRNRCPSGRIVALKCSECSALSKGHRDHPLDHWLWLVSLHLGSKRICAGSVLSHEWIVTAAHCVHKQAVGGRTVPHVEVKDQVAPAVEKVLIHPHYGSQSRDYDIAMLKLNEPLNFSETTQAICLPRYHQTIPIGSKCWIPGWDFTQPENAQAVEMNVPAKLMGTQKCNRSCAYAGELTTRMLCADYLDESTDACQSNSAGPLICQHEQTWHLVGIGSWGSRCAMPRRPGIFTKVTEFLDWIHHVMETYIIH
uniref:transmembrane protease serine 5 n=1 Tax=Euleptes europaea TaxID=460621 RepID=UPI0025420D99|nr:transmembrane protease serine 5 [Euleptes europaea]